MGSSLLFAEANFDADYEKSIAVVVLARQTLDGLNGWKYSQGNSEGRELGVILIFAFLLLQQKLKLFVPATILSPSPLISGNTGML